MKIGDSVYYKTVNEPWDHALSNYLEVNIREGRIISIDDIQAVVLTKSFWSGEKLEIFLIKDLYNNPLDVIAAVMEKMRPNIPYKNFRFNYNKC